MVHLRKQIRDKVKSVVLGLTSTGDRVHLTRLYSVPQLPALLVYITDEPAELDGKGTPANYWRFSELRIHGLAETTQYDLDDKLDQIAKEVEEAMAADVTLGGLVKRSVLTRTEIGLASEGEGEKQYGSVRLTYELRYRTAENDPDTANH